MDIFKKPGTKVIYKYPNWGYKCDQEKAKELLDLEREYTIEKISVGNYYTSVYLKEVPGVAFNSVLFE
jgi:hypothetical protein